VTFITSPIFVLATLRSSAIPQASTYVGGGAGGMKPNLRSTSTTARWIPALVRMSSMSHQQRRDIDLRLRRRTS
jgi:hypothetical protein